MLETVKSSFNLLSRKSKLYIFLSSLIQIIISVLDILGISFIAGAAILAVKLFGTSTGSINDNFIYKFLNSITNDDRKSIYLLLAFAFIFFISKSVMSAILFRKQLNFLIKRDSSVSVIAINKFLNRNLDSQSTTSSQEKIMAMSTGMWLSSSEILGNMIAILSEIGLLVFIILLLIFADFQLAMATLFYFLFIFAGMFFLVGKNLQLQSSQSTFTGLNQQNLLRIMLSAQREIRVFRRETFFAEKFLYYRSHYARSASNVLFLMYLPKVFIEVALVLGVFLLSIYQFFASDAVSAVSTLTLYLAAGTRILPSLLRLQNGISGLRAGIPGAQMFLNLLNASSLNRGFNPVDSYRSLQPGRVTEVSLEKVCFRYTSNSDFLINDISFRVEPGSLCAIVGESGSGKSTLVDLILGLNKPTSGQIFFNSLDTFDNTLDSVTVGYVPQNITIIPGSIRDNINFGCDFDDSEIWSALSMSGSVDFVASLPHQLDTVIEEDGLNLSGGQIQRIAIARALVNKPTLLILDEATSSLDMESHEYINSVLLTLKGQVTIISISHNWISLDSFDQIVQLAGGNLIYNGDFSAFKY